MPFPEELELSSIGHMIHALPGSRISLRGISSVSAESNHEQSSSFSRKTLLGSDSPVRVFSEIIDDCRVTIFPLGYLSGGRVGVTSMIVVSSSSWRENVSDLVGVSSISDDAAERINLGIHLVDLL